MRLIAYVLLSPAFIAFIKQSLRALFNFELVMLLPTVTLLLILYH
jgi:hypothetical protein